MQGVQEVLYKQVSNKKTEEYNTVSKIKIVFLKPNNTEYNIL